MRILSSLTMLLLLFVFAACGSDAPTEEELKAEAEVVELDSINQLLETSIIELEEDADELNDALEDLDELFPEEEDQ